MLTANRTSHCVLGHHLNHTLFLILAVGNHKSSEKGPIIWPKGWIDKPMMRVLNLSAQCLSEKALIYLLCLCLFTAQFGLLSNLPEFVQSMDLLVFDQLKKRKAFSSFAFSAELNFSIFKQVVGIIVSMFFRESSKERFWSVHMNVSHINIKLCLCITPHLLKCLYDPNLCIFLIMTLSNQITPRKPTSHHNFKIRWETYILVYFPASLMRSRLK